MPKKTSEKLTLPKLVARQLRFYSPKISFVSARDNLASYGMWVEAFTAAFLAKSLGAGDIAVDIGVNAGMHLFPMSSLVGPTGYVFGFEANPNLVDRVENRLFKNSIEHVTIVSAAVNDHSGVGKFVIYPENPGLSHIQHGGPVNKNTQGKKSKVVDIEFATVDNHVDGAVSAIKSDIEGADFIGLRGAKTILESSRPLIVFENGRKAAADAFGYSIDDFFEYFDEVDYNLFDIHGYPLRKGQWESINICYETLAIPREDPRLLSIMDFIEKFWDSALKHEPIKGWGQCVATGRSILAKL